MWENEEWWQNKHRTNGHSQDKERRGRREGEERVFKKDQISPIAACAQGEKVGFGFFFGLFVLGGGWLIGGSQWSQGRVMMKEVEKK